MFGISSLSRLSRCVGTNTTTKSILNKTTIQSKRLLMESNFGQLQQQQTRGFKVIHSNQPESTTKVRLVTLKNAEGPIHDLPDFRFADGTAAPETKTMRKWKNKKVREQQRKETLVKEMIEDIEKGNVQQFF